MFEITSSILSDITDHNAIKVKIDNQNPSSKYANTQVLNNSLLNNQRRKQTKKNKKKKLQESK